MQGLPIQCAQRVVVSAHPTLERHIQRALASMAKKISKHSSLSAPVRELLARPYSRVIVPSDAGVIAEVREFPGCSVQAETPRAACVQLERRAEKWLSEWLEQGKTLPRPFLDNHASGRFALRLPRRSYVRASTAAARERVSLNRYIANAVAERAGASSALAAWGGRVDPARRGSSAAPGPRAE
jgi:antitoxin HicB